jgi:hypothetical protein
MPRDLGELPALGVQGGDVVPGELLVVTSRSIVFQRSRVADLEAVSLEQAIPLLGTSLDEAKGRIRATCERNPASEECGAPVIVALGAVTSLRDSALVIAAAFEAWDGRVSILVRPADASPPSYERMQAEVCSWKGMRAVSVCPYALVTVKEVVPATSCGEGRGLLDGRKDGTIGELVSGLGSAGIVVGTP